MDEQPLKRHASSSASEGTVRFAFALCLAVTLFAPIISAGADLATAGIIAMPGVHNDDWISRPRGLQSWIARRFGRRWS
jgi:hypothetical protein